MPRFIEIAREDRLTVLTIVRPEAANALHPDASWEMAEAIDAFAADDEQWLLLLTGAGDRAFCAGTDLKYRSAHGRGGLPPSGFGGMTMRFDLTKPVIVAVNGVAYGGGFELALCCDIIVASDRARFALREVLHGLAALGGGIERLPRYVGLRLAQELILTGRDVLAQEALAIGIANAVAPADALMATAREWAGRLLKGGPLAVRASKQALMEGMDHLPLADAIARHDAYPAVIAMRESADSIEGVRAFAEKRAPNWQGK